MIFISHVSLFVCVEKKIYMGSFLVYVAAIVKETRTISILLYWLWHFYPLFVGRSRISV